MGVLDEILAPEPAAAAEPAYDAEAMAHEMIDLLTPSGPVPAPETPRFDSGRDGLLEAMSPLREALYRRGIIKVEDQINDKALMELASEAMDDGVPMSSGPNHLIHWLLMVEHAAMGLGGERTLPSLLAYRRYLKGSNDDLRRAGS